MHDDEKHEKEFKARCFGRWFPDDRLVQLRDKAVSRGIRGDEVFEFINLEVKAGLEKAVKMVDIAVDGKCAEKWHDNELKMFQWLEKYKT